MYHVFRSSATRKGSPRASFSGTLSTSTSSTSLRRGRSCSGRRTSTTPTPARERRYFRYEWLLMLKKCNETGLQSSQVSLNKPLSIPARFRSTTGWPGWPNPRTRRTKTERTPPSPCTQPHTTNKNLDIKEKQGHAHTSVRHSGNPVKKKITERDDYEEKSWME